MFSVPSTNPTEWVEVVLLPLIALFFGLVIFLVGEFNTGESRRPKKWKWVGVAILLFGALLGYRYFLPMVTGSIEATIYKEQLRGYGRKMLVAHWFAFLGPFLSALIAVLISWTHGKRLADTHDEL